MAILFKWSCQSASSATNVANIDAMLKKLIEKRLTCFKACWELGARRKPKVLKLRYSPVCAIKKGNIWPQVHQCTNHCMERRFFNMKRFYAITCHISIKSVLFKRIKRKKCNTFIFIFFLHFARNNLRSVAMKFLKGASFFLL